jgi:outer membrane protein insertion porin family
MKKRLLTAWLAAWTAGAALAMDPFVVKDIRVEGLQRTEPGTVFSYLPVKVGDTLDDERASTAIKALYATGFFKDVRLETRDGVLIVTVEERPSIATITLTGIKEFSDEDLKNGLKQAGLSEGRVFDKALLDKAEQELKRQYYNRGKYSVQVITTTTPLERNRVAVQFDVIEGDAAKIRQINVVGNKAFSEKKLLGEFSSTTPGWLTWYTKSDQYSKSKLSGDLEKLRSFYLDQGYLEFAVDSTQVSISPDKKEIYITVNISEGEKYTVSDIKFAGQMLIPEDELKKLVDVKPGETFSRQKLSESTKKISDRLGNDGFAFANVNAVPDVDKEKRQVAFTLFIDPGRRVYVRQVNIAGNTKTRDEVIRREIRQLEDGWYNAEKIETSRNRLNRLNFFNEVNVETPPVAGTTDQVDLDVTVSEKATGNVLVGAGFSSSEGLILSGSVNQNNVFGTGNRLAVQINSGSVNTVYSLSFTNPYYTLDGVSLGYDIYRRDVDASSLDGVGEYESSTYGIGTRLGLPISERNTLFLGAAIEQFDVATTSTSPIQYQNYVNQFGSSNYTLRLDASLARDNRDSILFPTKGSFQRFGVEAGVPPGDLKYYKLSAQHQQFFPLSKSFTLMINGEVGYAAGYGDSGLPFFKNFFAGGVSSVRGYETGTIGPKALSDQSSTVLCDPVTLVGCEKVSLGGDTRFIGNIELFFPLPGVKDNSVRISTFFDAGAVFGAGDYLGRYGDLSFDDLRYSAGVSLAWNSPLGPLRFSLAYPINPAEDDQEQAFQFNLGTTF